MEHVAWVADALKRMQTIKPGMTRKELRRDCPCFKVDVEFEVVGRPPRDAAGRVTLVEGDMDRIVTMSRPYLQFSILD